MFEKPIKNYKNKLNCNISAGDNVNINVNKRSAMHSNQNWHNLKKNEKAKQWQFVKACKLI